MRELFKSEARAIANLLSRQWSVSVAQFGKVLSEQLVLPRVQTTRPRFNTDFVLEFAERPFPDRATACATTPIIPNSVGASVNLLIEMATYRPLLFEMMFGESFGVESFAPYIREVQTSLESLWKGASIFGPVRDNRALRIVESAFLRVMVVEHDVCFLAFPKDASAEVRGVRRTLVRSDQQEVDCYVDGEEVICCDGWVRTDIAPRECSLVALPA